MTQSKPVDKNGVTEPLAPQGIERHMMGAFIAMCDTLRQLDGEELLKFDRSVLQSSQFYQYLFIQCRNKIPKDQLYTTTIDTYFFSGFDFPKQAILDIMDLRPDDYLKDLPKQYESCDAIPVVRAT